MKQAGVLIMQAIQAKTMHEAEIYCLQIEIRNYEALIRHKQNRFERIADEGLDRMDAGQRPGTSQILGNILVEIDALRTQLDLAQLQFAQLTKAA